jgi:hypothetical protein
MTRITSCVTSLSYYLYFPKVIRYFQQHYTLSVQSIVYGTEIVYHEDFMAVTDVSMRECLDPIPKDTKFVTLVVMFHGKEANEVLGGPAVRYHLKAAAKKRKTKPQ